MLIPYSQIGEIGGFRLAGVSPCFRVDHESFSGILTLLIEGSLKVGLLACRMRVKLRFSRQICQVCRNGVFLYRQIISA